MEFKKFYLLVKESYSFFTKQINNRITHFNYQIINQTGSAINNNINEK